MRHRNQNWTPLWMAALLVPFLSCRTAPSSQVAQPDSADVVIVGAGIAGLSAALELSRGGAEVLVIDMASIFGGHAVSAHGGLSIAGSPVQKAAGIEDSPEIAFRDYTTWGEDADEEWVRYYVEESASQVHDWLVEQGVEFTDVWHLDGNSVPRFHNIEGRGLGLVTPIYRSCLKEGVRFHWNTVVDELVAEQGRVVGVRGQNQRTRERLEFRAQAVMLATGGFQSNLERVRENWDSALPFPDQILAGSGWNSQGLGLDLAARVNARFHRLDHQWNYVTGLPDPRYPDLNRGLKLNAYKAVWVNAEGARFVNPCASPKFTLPAVVRQPTGTFWAILDSQGRRDMVISGTDWSDQKVESLIVSNPELVQTAASVPELARKAGLPERALSRTVTGFNSMVAQGLDTEFGRFGTEQDIRSACQDVIPLREPPFYAIRLFPMARKSMGGVQIDRAGRVESAGGGVVAGLYAAGEVAGFAGVNGRAGLEGTFLGPSIVTGRVGARTILAELAEQGGLDPKRRAGTGQDEQDETPDGTSSVAADNALCTRCHNLQALTRLGRPGFWHFELSHQIVQQEGLQCVGCHSELFPYKEGAHRVDPMVRSGSCTRCHGSQKVD